MKRAVAADRKPSLKVQTVQRWGNKAKWRGSRATRRSSLEISPESRPNAAVPSELGKSLKWARLEKLLPGTNLNFQRSK